jgi:hypothetical protein
MNKRVVNNVHLKKKAKKKNFNSANAGPKPGWKRRRVTLQACKSLLSLLKAGNPISVYVSVYLCIFYFYFEIKSLCYIVI